MDKAKTESFGSTQTEIYRAYDIINTGTGATSNAYSSVRFCPFLEIS